MQVWQILLIVLAILIAVTVVLYFVGKRLQKRQDAQKEQIDAAKQTMELLIIDKKRMRINQSGLPQMVIDQVPKLMRRNRQQPYRFRMRLHLYRMLKRSFWKKLHQTRLPLCFLRQLQRPDLPQKSSTP